MTAPIDFYATYPHYIAHLQPIRDALPDDRKGFLYVPSNLRPRPEGAHVRYATPPSSEGLLIVAGYQDLRYANRPKVLLNHGAGQTYASVDSPSYVGGPGREQAGLFLEPNQACCDAELARYPNAHAVAVGCPLLDKWMKIPAPGDGTIGVTCHWPARLRTVEGEDVPESGWAFDSWRDTITELAKSRKIIGHAHPRARQLLEAFWASIGVEAVWDAAAFLARIDVLVADNTSLLPEFGACGRPLVWLNDATWRKDVEHGGRFWDWPRGQVMCWPTDDLSAAIDRALYDPPDVRAAREAMVESIYGTLDGHAAERAVEAILKWEAGLT